MAYHVKVSGVMGVPISFLMRYNPKQFRIVSANDIRHKGWRIPVKTHGLIKDREGTVKGRAKFVRVCVVRRS